MVVVVLPVITGGMGTACAAEAKACRVLWACLC